MPQGMPGFEMPQYQPINYAPQMPAPQPQRGGMFGGKAGGIVNALAEMAATYAAGMGAPQGLQSINARKQQQVELQQSQVERENKYQDWVRQQQWQLEHPEARAPHYFESNSGDQYTIGPDGQPQLVFKDPLRYKFIPNGQGGVVPVDVEKLMGGGSAQPEILSELPPGAKPMGGAGPSQAPRPFPFR